MNVHGLSSPTPFSPVSRRVDTDIAGTSNSLLRTSSKQEVPRPWLDEDSDWDKIVIERKIMHIFENDALLRYPPNFTGGYSFINRDIVNAYGPYRIFDTSHIFFNVRFLCSFLKFISVHSLCLLLDGCKVQADVEPSSSTMLNLNLPGERTYGRFP